MRKIYKCTSKYQFKNILYELPTRVKNFLLEYIEKCFIIHLHLRPLNNKINIMTHREVIFRAISDPEILNGNMKFANNLVKNFCKGVINFVVLFFDDLVKFGFLRKEGVRRKKTDIK